MLNCGINEGDLGIRVLTALINAQVRPEAMPQPKSGCTGAIFPSSRHELKAWQTGASMYGRSKTAALTDRDTFVCGHSAITGQSSVCERLLAPKVSGGPRPKAGSRVADLPMRPAVERQVPRYSGQPPEDRGNVRYRRPPTFARQI